VHHIHGEIDRIIPLKGVRPDEVVPQGGHLINLTHTGQVNRFIERCLGV
jgi:pimeloyl-ACP methyl ester carboxylesterase